jgi:hypothetical protein
MTVALVNPPATGNWRVGPDIDPYAPRPVLQPLELNDPTAGNRFDSPLAQFRTLYFATELGCCFAETLSRHRPDPQLLPIIEEEWR